jgi:membrane protein DedA with SNARE-associated domain
MEHFVTTFAKNGYLAVFVLMALESACIPIPSEVTMLFAGALSSSAFASIAPGAPRLNIVAVIVIGIIANVAGSVGIYWVGRAIGREPLDRYGKYVLIRPHDIDKAEAWWTKHGQGAVFFGRLLPVIRTFISLPAGIAEMRFGTFVGYTLAGCIPWVAALGAAGYGLGKSWSSIVKSFNIATYAIAGLIVVAIVAFFIRRRSQSRTAA